jgi:hypothetical protein
MNRKEMVEAIGEALHRAPDRDRGRRLALVIDAGGWQIGYQIPRYLEPWAVGDEPARWVVFGWLTEGPGAGEPALLWEDLDEAAALAFDLRNEALDAAGPLPGELVVVIDDRPQVVVV